MSTRVPNRYAEALRPVSASTYCGSPPTKSSYAETSSRGVNLLRALGCTTTLIAAWGAPGSGNSPPTKVAKDALLGARVNKVATPDLRAVFFGGPPYLLGVDVPSKAGHNRPVCPQEHDDARVACQI